MSWMMAAFKSKYVLNFGWISFIIECKDLESNSQHMQIAHLFMAQYTSHTVNTNIFMPLQPCCSKTEFFFRSITYNPQFDEGSVGSASVEEASLARRSGKRNKN